jgi:hypothetical protein
MTATDFIHICIVAGAIVFIYKGLEKKREERDLMEDDDD